MSALKFLSIYKSNCFCRNTDTVFDSLCTTESKTFNSSSSLKLLAANLWWIKVSAPFWSQREIFSTWRVQEYKRTWLVGTKEEDGKDKVRWKADDLLWRPLTRNAERKEEGCNMSTVTSTHSAKETLPTFFWYQQFFH